MIKLGDIRPQFTDPPERPVPQVVLTTPNMPDFDSYFKGADPAGPPDAISGGSGTASLNYVLLDWDLSPYALFRTYEIYEGTTEAFTPDTVLFSNRVMETTQQVISIKKDPGSGPFYYKVCAVNTRAERSTFSTLGPYTLGKVTTQDIVDDAVTSAKVATGAIGTTELSAGAVTAAALASGAVNLGANTVVGSLAAGRLSAGTLAAGVIYGGTVTTNQLVASGALIGSALIADGSITNAKIGAAAIDSAKIADAAITSAKIGDAQITSAKIVSIDAAKINVGTLTGFTIIGSRIQTGVSGARLEIGNASYFHQLAFFNSSNSYCGGLALSTSTPTFYAPPGISLVLAPDNYGQSAIGDFGVDVRGRLWADNMASGTTSFTVGTGVTSQPVNFPAAFPAAGPVPRVLVMPHTSVPHQVHVGVTSLSRDGFTIQAKRDDSSTATTFSWFAYAE